MLRPQNSPALQLNFDPGRAVPYDLDSRIQHDPEPIRIAGMVTELIGLCLDKALEPTLIYTEVVLLREPAGCVFEREVMCLQNELYTGDFARREQQRDLPKTKRSKTFVPAFARTQNQRHNTPQPFLGGSGVSTRQ